MSLSSDAKPRSAYSQSTSQSATTCSVARLTRLERPWPPTPTAATLKRSLGGVCPRPRTWRGTIAIPAPVSATSDTKSRRVIFFVIGSSVRLKPDTTAYGSRTLRRRSRRGLRQRPDADVAKPEHAGVIALQPDVAAPGASELRPRVELRRLDLGFPVAAPQLVLDHFDVVEPVLDVRAVDDDARLVPLADRLQMPRRRRIQAVGRGRAGEARLVVLGLVVVEQLILRTGGVDPVVVRTSLE